MRGGELTAAQARNVERTFAADLRAGVFALLPVEESHYWQAFRWLTRRRTALRTLDALHLACADGQALPLVTADKTLADAATTLGCEVQYVAPPDG